MAGTILTRKRQVAAAIEAVEGTAETLENVDGGLLVIDPKWEPDVKLFPRNVVSNTFSKFRMLPGQQSAVMTFTSEIKGSGAAGVPPAISKYLKACGMSEVVTEVVSTNLDQDTDGTTDNKLRDASGVNERLAAEWAAGSETVTHVKLMLKRVGAVAVGKKIWVEIQGDSTGVPDNTPISGGTSNKIEAGSLDLAYQKVTFVFPAPVTVPAAAHHLVLRGDYTQSATINVQWRSFTVGSGGNMEQYTASAWGETDTEDLEVQAYNGTNVVYKPTTDSISSLTIGMYTGDDAASGIQKVIKGARGSVKFTSKAGEPMLAEFTFTGVAVAPVDAAPLSPVEYDNATEPPVMLSASLTVQGLSAQVLGVDLDLANQIVLRDDINTAEGYKSALITDRRPVGSIDPEEVLVATHDFYGKLKSGAEGILTFSMGSVAGNQVAFNCPKTQYTKLAESDRNGLAALGLDLAINRDADTGNDELTITLT